MEKKLINFSKKYLILFLILLSGCVHKNTHLKNSNSSNASLNKNSNTSNIGSNDTESSDDKNQNKADLSSSSNNQISNATSGTVSNENQNSATSSNPYINPSTNSNSGSYKNLNKSLPKFGFIFSGGGAKAWAHIGFLKELQRYKWPVHSVAGFEWGSVVAATYAQNLSVNEVEWEMSKLKEFEKTDTFVKSVFEKKTTSEMKVPFVCPSLNISKQAYYLLNRGQMQQLIPFCIPAAPLVAPFSQSVAVMSDVASLAQHLRSTGANRIILINVLAQQKLRSFVNDYASAENIMWVESAALMAKKPVGVDDVVQIQLDDFGIKDLEKRREIILKGNELSIEPLKKLAQKYGL